MAEHSPHPTSPSLVTVPVMRPTACSVSQKCFLLRDTGTSALLRCRAGWPVTVPPPSPDGVSPAGRSSLPEAGPPRHYLDPLLEEQSILITLCMTSRKSQDFCHGVIPCQLPRGWAPDLDLTWLMQACRAGWVGTCWAASPLLRTPLLSPKPLTHRVGPGLDLEPSTSSLPSQHDSPAAQKTHGPHPCHWSCFGGQEHNCSQKSQKLPSTLTPSGTCLLVTGQVLLPF